MAKRVTPKAVRFPTDQTLETAKQKANQLNISLNKYIVEAVKEKNNKK